MQLEKITKADLTKISDDELKTCLRECLGLSVQAIIAAAHLVKEADRRRLALDDVQVWMMGYIRRVACGSLAASALVRFIEDEKLLNDIATLPFAEQERLGAGGFVKVYLDKDNKSDDEMMAPLDMPRPLQKRVFAPGRIRSQAEQRALALVEAKETPIRTAITIHLSEDEYEVLSAKAVARGESVQTCVLGELRRKKII